MKKALSQTIDFQIKAACDGNFLSLVWIYLCAENMRPNLGNFGTKQVLLVSLCEKNKMFWTALYVSLILFIEVLTVLAYIREHLLAGLWLSLFERNRS